jgi:flagellar hook assembly protein FlgD
LHKPCKVTLKIYNSLGQEVSTLVDQFQEAGSYNNQWDAKSNASGLYFYHLKTEYPDNIKSEEVKKMLLLK